MGRRWFLFAVRRARLATGRQELSDRAAWLAFEEASNVTRSVRLATRHCLLHLATGALLLRVAWPASPSPRLPSLPIPMAPSPRGVIRPPVHVPVPVPLPEIASTLSLIPSAGIA
jgi:hypothetical protein